MARNDSPPDSPLSSMSSSDEFEEEAMMDDLPPPKRQKIGDGSTASSAVVAPEVDPLDEMSQVSEDTDGEVPSSPVNTRWDDEENQEQVTTCAWEGCHAGEMENMDKLVEHIHNDHIEGKQKKYTCEWVGCNRKSMPHASGYALKAHMRSHTREKPFYCYLPGSSIPGSRASRLSFSANIMTQECDRAFTRSDALAKHMRTVHETEALRPSDPVPKSMQTGGPAKGSSKLKIIIKTPQSHAAGQEDAIDDGSNGDDVAENLTPMTEDHGFTKKELDMPLERLYGLCRNQVKWAERDGEELKTECKQWEEVYKRAWLEKQVLLDQVIQGEMDYHDRRKAVLSGAADVQIAPEVVINGPSNGEAAAVTNGDSGAGHGD